MKPSRRLAILVLLLAGAVFALSFTHSNYWVRFFALLVGVGFEMLGLQWLFKTFRSGTSFVASIALSFACMSILAVASAVYLTVDLATGTTPFRVGVGLFVTISSSVSAGFMFRAGGLHAIGELWKIYKRRNDADAPSEEA